MGKLINHLQVAFKKQCKAKCQWTELREIVHVGHVNLLKNCDCFDKLVREGWQFNILIIMPQKNGQLRRNLALYYPTVQSFLWQTRWMNLMRPCHSGSICLQCSQITDFGTESQWHIRFKEFLTCCSFLVEPFSPLHFFMRPAWYPNELTPEIFCKLSFQREEWCILNRYPATVGETPLHGGMVKQSRVPFIHSQQLNNAKKNSMNHAFWLNRYGSSCLSRADNCELSKRHSC